MIADQVILKPVVAAAFPVMNRENRQKLPPGQKAVYSTHQKGPKGAYVPPHLRSSTGNQHGGKTNNYNNNHKNQKGGFRRNDKPNWRGNNNNTSDSDSGRRNFQTNKGQSHFQAWNKKEAARKEKKEEKVIIKPHCELFLTNLPPQMRSIAGLAAFFHPYGEVAQIQVINQGDTIPENVMKWCQKDNLEPSHSAIVEFQTARTAKFVVGVLRKRLSQLNFRVGLIKPGLGEEFAYQRKTYGDIVYQPSSGMTQQYIVTKTVITDTSSDSSEVDMRAPVKRIVKRLVTANRVQQSDQAYWSQSSSTISSSSDHVSSSESDPASDSDNRAGSPISSQASSTCGKIEEIQETLQKDLVVSV